MGARGSDTRRRRIKRELRMVEDVCWLCGLPLDDNAPAFTDWATEIDELVPVRHGGCPYGTNTPLHLVHRCCNNHRNAKQYRNLPADAWAPGMFYEWANSKLAGQTRRRVITSRFL